MKCLTNTDVWYRDSYSNLLTLEANISLNLAIFLQTFATVHKDLYIGGHHFIFQAKRTLSSSLRVKGWRDLIFLRINPILMCYKPISYPCFQYSTNSFWPTSQRLLCREFLTVPCFQDWKLICIFRRDKAPSNTQTQQASWSK